MSYEAEWSHARKRTARFGLDVPKHANQPSKRFLNELRHREFPYVVHNTFGVLSERDVVLQCISIHYRLLPVIEEWLGCPVTYTLGWVEISNSSLFKFDDAFIESMLKNGHSGGPVNIHAWLTLPSLEIINMSLPTSYAVVKKSNEDRGGVIASHADELVGMIYKPMLAGYDFLFRSGLAVGFFF